MADKKVGISIIMPCYNTEKYLKKTLASIFGQTFQDFELIMVDDGSKDSTPQLLDKCKEEHPDKVKVIHKENGGQSTARNVAFDIAEGEYCVFWDSDDYADVNYLEVLYETAKANDSDMVVSGSHYIDENGVIIENLNLPVDKYPGYIGRRLSPHGKLYRLDFINKHNIRFAAGKRYEDNPFNFMAMFLSENQVVLPIAYHYQVVHTGSSTSSAMVEDKMPYDAIEQALKYMRSHRDEINDYPLYEYTVLSFMTYFIFLGNREHMRAAHDSKKGYKNGKALIGHLCDFTQRVIPKELPTYYNNRYVRSSKDTKGLEFRQRAGVWLFTKLLKTHTLKSFAMLYYSIIK